MVWYGMVEVCEGAPVAVSGRMVWYGGRMVWYGMVDACDGYLAAEHTKRRFFDAPLAPVSPSYF